MSESYVTQIGPRFKRPITRRDGTQGTSSPLATFRCSCGKEFVAFVSNVNRGFTSSCGCRKGAWKHGKSHTATYKSWNSMIGRCYIVGTNGYDRYGGRGIVVCDRWRLSFEAFLEDMGERPDGMTLDRIASDGNYVKENCRWATAKQQQRNRSVNHRISHGGENLTIAEWNERLGSKFPVVQGRLRNGWTEGEAVSKPIQERYRKANKESEA